MRIIMALFLLVSIATGASAQVVQQAATWDELYAAFERGIEVKTNVIEAATAAREAACWGEITMSEEKVLDLECNKIYSAVINRFVAEKQLLEYMLMTRVWSEAERRTVLGTANPAYQTSDAATEQLWRMAWFKYPPRKQVSSLTKPTTDGRGK